MSVDVHVDSGWAKGPSRAEDERWTVGQQLKKNVGALCCREKETKAVFSIVVPRKSTGQWICRRVDGVAPRNRT